MNIDKLDADIEVRREEDFMSAIFDGQDKCRRLGSGVMAHSEAEKAAGCHGHFEYLRSSIPCLDFENPGCVVHLAACTLHDHLEGVSLPVVATVHTVSLLRKVAVTGRTLLLLYRSAAESTMITTCDEICFLSGFRQFTEPRHFVGNMCRFALTEL